MVYRLTKSVKVLSNGFNGRKGQAVAPGQIPPALWGRWRAEGVVTDVERESLEARAKEAGIPNYWSMNVDTLRERLEEHADEGSQET